MKLVTISKVVVEGLLKWNTSEFISSHSHDRRFLKALLVACLGKVNIENNIINDITLDFVKGELKNYIGQTKTWK